MHCVLHLFTLVYMVCTYKHLLLVNKQTNKQESSIVNLEMLLHLKFYS